MKVELAKMLESVVFNSKNRFMMTSCFCIKQKHLATR